jgi:hypothetical protein
MNLFYNCAISILDADLFFIILRDFYIFLLLKKIDLKYILMIKLNVWNTDRLFIYI